MVGVVLRLAREVMHDSNERVPERHHVQCGGKRAEKHWCRGRYMPNITNEGIAVCSWGNSLNPKADAQQKSVDSGDVQKCQLSSPVQGIVRMAPSSDEEEEVMDVKDCAVSSSN